MMNGGEIMISVNGEKMQCPVNMNLKEFLESRGYYIKFVATECNGQIIPKAAYEKEIVEDGDTLEVVSFVGGG